MIILILALPVLITERGSLLIAKLIWIFGIGFASYQIFTTGLISKWRSAFFIIVALAFLLEFKSKLIGLTGSAWKSQNYQEVPYCHIAIAASILNQLYTQYLALIHGNYHLWSPLIAASLFWLIGTLSIGQGWCSWACFYGGFDTAFSRILPRPLKSIPRISQRARDFSLVLLITFLLLSWVRMEPSYCLWLCPLKISTAFLDPDSWIRKIQLGIFTLAGILFIIALPIIVKKRTFCTFLCPFGAWQALAGRLNPFRVKINPAVCTRCKECVKVCPVYALDLKGSDDHRVSGYCNRCGDCMDVCPTGAISYQFANAGPSSSDTARFYYLISAWVVGGGVSLLFVPSAGLRILHAFNSLSGL